MRCSVRNLPDLFRGARCRKRNNHGRREGFTLLEVLIALAIVSGLLVTLIYTINYQIGIVERQETVTIGTLLGKHKLKDLEKNPQSVTGKFDPPYDTYAFATFVKESPYAGISEIIVVITSGKEKITLNAFIPQ